MTKEDLRNENVLGMTWDTLGWAYFRGGELDKAEKFINAAWVLLQSAVVADHLGQVYQKQGKKGATDAALYVPAGAGNAKRYAG